MPTTTINNPDRTWDIQTPDENKLFRLSGTDRLGANNPDGYSYGYIKNGQLVQLDPYAYFLQKSGANATQGAGNIDIYKKYGIPLNSNPLPMIMQKGMEMLKQDTGLDFSKITGSYAPALLAQAGIKLQGGQLDVNAVKTMSNATGATGNGQTETLTGNQAIDPVTGKPISGAGVWAGNMPATGPQANTPEENAMMAEQEAQQGANQTPGATGTPNGYTPTSKGLTTGKESLQANAEWINKLFQEYHGRPANAQELQYWANKKLGDIEKMFTQTTIFNKEDAEKIREQMMAQGLTYIPNQAELEKLSQGAGVTAPPNAGSMLFQSQPSNTGASGTGSGTGTGSGAGTGAGTGSSGSGDPTDALADQIADAVGDPNAGEDEILSALEKLKTGQIDPYYKQLIGQAQQDITTSINRRYEDRIRELQSESYNLSENIKNSQKTLAGKGLTFSGEAMKQLGTLSAFAQGTPAGLTPAQLGQTGEQVAGGQPINQPSLPAPATGLPQMTAEQMGLEGSVNMKNRLTAESSRTGFNRDLENIGTDALRLLGTQGVTGLGLPAQSTNGQPNTTGTMQYDYAKTLQSLYGNLTGQEGTMTGYQGLFL